MKRCSFSELLQMTPEDIQKEIISGRKSLFQFRFRTDASEVKPHQISYTRRHVARLKAALNEKKLLAIKGE